MMRNGLKRPILNQGPTSDMNFQCAMHCFSLSFALHICNFLHCTSKYCLFHQWREPMCSICNVANTAVNSWPPWPERSHFVWAWKLISWSWWEIKWSLGERSAVIKGLWKTVDNTVAVVHKSTPWMFAQGTTDLLNVSVGGSVGHTVPSPVRCIEQSCSRRVTFTSSLSHHRQMWRFD